jgi:threonine aldolase
MEIVVTGRHDFASDNVAGVMPEVLDALAVANVGVASGYGDDRVTRQACDMIRGALDADAEVRFMTSGTAANALALAMLAEPHEAVLAHKHAHVCTDETGAPAFFGSGMGVMGLPGASGQIDADALVAALDEPDTAHNQPAAALSLTQVTEYGTLYPEAALAALAAEAKARGYRLHLDGARLANAVAGGFDLKVIPRLGVDVLVMGGTKAGATPTEALVLFDKGLARRLDARLKHAGQLVSKGRFLAAPWIGMLQSGAWSARAGHANAMARKLAMLSPFPVAHTVDANAVFVVMDEPALQRLRRRGWFVYRFLDGTVRFMCNWSTTPDAVEELASLLAEIA